MLSLSNMNVKTKLLVLCGAFIVGIAIFAGVTYSTIQAVRIGGDQYNSLTKMQDFSADLIMPDATFVPSMYEYYRILLSGNSEEAKQEIELFHEAQNRFQEKREAWLKDLGDDTELKDALSKAYLPVDELFQVINNQVIPLVLAGKMSDALQVRREKTIPLFKQHKEGIEQVTKLTTERIQNLEAQSAASVRNRLMVTFAVLLICLIAAMIFAWKIATEIVEQLREKLDVLKKVAQGDLSERLEVNARDEIGDLAKAINETIDGLVDIVSKIRDDTKQLATESQGLSAASQQLGTSAQQSSSGAHSASAAAQQVNNNIQTVSSATAEMTATVSEIAKNAAEAARVAGSAQQLTAETHSTMTKLSESSAEIGNVIKVITSIAEQTNLLALNATIEAARAGEAGKGFAVVANEVKELAKETAKATEDIGNRVQAIQNDANGTVHAINEITSVIGRINDIQNTIASSIEEQTSATNEIARNIGETSEGTSDIAKNISEVAEAAGQTQQSAASLQKSADSLSRLSQDLETVVSRFHLAAGNGAARAAHHHA